jgi:hypothetical protein
VVGGTVVCGTVAVGATVEVVVVTTGLTAVGFVALVEDEHAAAPIDKDATATRATRLIIPPQFSMLTAARYPSWCWYRWIVVDIRRPLGTVPPPQGRQLPGIGVPASVDGRRRSLRDCRSL